MQYALRLARANTQTRVASGRAEAQSVCLDTVGDSVFSFRLGCRDQQPPPGSYTRLRYHLRGVVAPRLQAGLAKPSSRLEPARPQPVAGRYTPQRV